MFPSFPCSLMWSCDSVRPIKDKQKSGKPFPLFLLYAGWGWDGVSKMERQSSSPGSETEATPSPRLVFYRKQLQTLGYFYCHYCHLYHGCHSCSLANTLPASAASPCHTLSSALSVQTPAPFLGSHTSTSLQAPGILPVWFLLPGMLFPSLCLVHSYSPVIAQTSPFQESCSCPP